MKKLTFGVMLLCLAAACKKENRSDNKKEPTINGNWTLASYSGGVAGFKHRKADVNPLITLNITADGVYRQYNNGAIATQGSYTVLKNFPFGNTLTADALKVDNDILGAVSLRAGNQDTLYITPLPQWPDAMTLEYTRSNMR